MISSVRHCVNLPQQRHLATKLIGRHAATELNNIGLADVKKSFTSIYFRPIKKAQIRFLSTNAVNTAAVKPFDNLQDHNDLRALRQEIKSAITGDKNRIAHGMPIVDPNSLKALDSDIIRRIEAELAEADVNADGRIDAHELKQLLSKHNAAFTDADVVEIGELFYASKAGGSVSFERFIRAIDYAASAPGDEEDKTLGGQKHANPLGIGTCAPEYMFVKSHGKYTPEELNVKLTHIEPNNLLDKAALGGVKAVRFVFDTATGWNRGDITTDKILNRTIFLETVAAIPGMVAAIIRHFKSLRNMQRDGGMLNMFLEEATNERMHLLTFIKMKDPGSLFRAAVIGGQIGFGSAFLLSYMASPAFCHRFVGYIEEEACHTYTKIIEEIEKAPVGTNLAEWRTDLAPKIARSYWKLGEGGTVLDMIYAVRADEAEHRDVNHAVSGLPQGHVNPLYDPETKLNQMLLAYVKDVMQGNNKDGEMPLTKAA